MKTSIQSASVHFFNRIYSFLMRIARADMAFFVLGPIMMLLVVGTVAQKYMGLYAAHKMFFSSFVFFWGIIPFPGGYSLIGLLSVFLTLKFVLKSKWSWRKSGIILAHFGSLVLLVGGLITALAAQESFMVIPEGGQSTYTYDYIDKNLYVYRDNLLYMEVPFDDLQVGFDLYLDDTILTVRDRCVNCEIIRRGDSEEFIPIGMSVKHLAEFMALKPAQEKRAVEENLSGFIFDLHPADDGAVVEHTGRYIAFDAMPKPIQWSAYAKNDNGGEDVFAVDDDETAHDYIMTFGKAQRELPFALKLIDFQEDLYPGEEKARRFHSDVVVLDGGAEWPARIEMNKPLRYKGYTIYQSSFDRTEDGAELTVLSVVKNKGRLVPYIGTFLLALGLILHGVYLIRRRPV